LFAQGGGGGGGGSAATQVAEFTATQGQTNFTLPFTYIPDQFNLAVFVNGSKQIVDVNYSESSSTTITFFTGLNVGDAVEVIYNLPIAAGQLDASNILYDEGGVGAVESTVQKKLQESVSVLDFGADPTGATVCVTAIQNAINAVSAAGGGIVNLPPGQYNLGTGSPAISIPSFVHLVGQGDATGGTTAGKNTELLYGGSGTAVYAQGMSILCSDFSIQATAPSGTTMIGLEHDGGWFGTYQRLSIRGIPAANGNVVKVTSGPVAYGCYFTCFDQVDGSNGSWLITGRNANDGITTFTMKDCYVQNASFAYAQGVLLNGSYTSNTGAILYFSTSCFFSLIGLDIEGSATSAICINDNTSVIKEFGTIWQGWSGTTRVLNAGSNMSYLSYGPFSSQQTLTANTPVLWNELGGQASSTANAIDFVSDYVLPTNVIGGSQSASRYWMRYNNGANIIDHQWREHAYITKSITTSSTSPYTVWTIPVAPSEGLRLSVFAHGSQIGDTAFANSRNCNVSNNSGTLTLAADTQLTAGSTDAISFVASGQNVLVQWTPSTANTSTPNFNLEIRGLWSSYS
jgi:hypothetical protein